MRDPFSTYDQWKTAEPPEWYSDEEEEPQIPMRTIQDLVDEMKCGPLKEALRAYARHGMVNIVVTLVSGAKFTYRDVPDYIRPYTEVATITLCAIPWDGTDTEFTAEGEVGDFHALLKAIEEQQAEYEAERDAEDPNIWVEED